MKVIMLDVDGVLNCSSTKEQVQGYTFVSDEKLELLKQLVDRTKAKVVLTSTWRHGWDDMDKELQNQDVDLFLALKDKLWDFGIELMDYTPITNGGMDRRGEEIDLWMKEWDGEPIESFVVLDDLNGCYLRPYSARLVRTSFTKGLLQKHVDLAVKILNNPLAEEKKEVP